MSKKRFPLATLGCRTNQYETQAYHDQLHQLGYLEAEEGEEVIVTVCLAERRPDLIQKIGGISSVFPNKEKEHLIASLFPD